MKTLVLALATTALTATVASAAGISSIDQNGDRFASKAEVAAQYPGLSAADFRDVDSNNDGRWSAAEFNTGEAKAIVARNVPGVGGVVDVAGLDTDGSGFVSEAELAAAYPGLTSFDFDDIDANNDQRISSVELYNGDAQAIVSRYDAATSGVLVALDVIDTDNSGFASLSELSAQYRNLSQIDFDRIDTNNDNRISFNELYDGDALTVLGKNL